MNKKQMRMGSLALSVLLASSLSAPTTVMAAETTTSETNQTEVSAAADSAVTEQPVASASTDQAAESAPEEQTVSSAPGEQPAASDPDEQTAESASSELAVVPESMPASDKHSANERTLDLAAVATPSDVIVEDSKVANSSEPAEEASASNEQSPESTAAGKDVQPAPQQETKKGIEEPAVDKATTAPNNVNEAAPSDEKQGSDISYKASLFGIFPLADSTATITPEDANSGKTLGDVSSKFKGTGLGDVKAGDLVVKGDMSIEGNTTKDAAHDAEKDSKHDIKADLDVSAIHTSIEESGNMLSDTYGGANAAKAVYVNNLETGLRSTFTFGSDMSGEFYVPASLEDAKAHYILSSADGAPLIYRINYANSTFSKDKVTILMDLDLTRMDEKKTTYDNSTKVLYGENGVKENFNHTEAEYGDTFDTSTFGNLQQLITSSARKISLLLKDVLFHSATGNSNTTETEKETTTTTQGSINGTLVGYMKANVGHNRVKGNVSYVWGAMQDANGKDINAKDDKVMLTTQFTETTPKNNPVTPGTPDTKDTQGTQDVTGNADAQSTSVTTAAPVSQSTQSAPNTPVHPVALSTPNIPGADMSTVTQATVNHAASAVAEKKISDRPQTGDTGNLYLWFLSIIASAGLFLTGIVHLKKKNIR